MADDNDGKIDTARRRLLKSAVYVPPAIIGVVSLMEGCAPGSCSPRNCVPQNGCNPNNGCNPSRTCNPSNPCNPNNCRPGA